MNDCIFCKIVAREILSHVLYEDTDVLVFLDAFPATVGHALVVPKTHATNIYDADPALIGKVFAKASELGPKIAEAVGANGFRVLMNNGESAGQTVFHPHVHVMPTRAKGDIPAWDQIERSAEELAGDAEKILSALDV